MGAVMSCLHHYRHQPWSWLLGGLTGACFLAAIVYPKIFWELGIIAMYPTFSDLIAILAAGEADQLGWDVFASNPLDPLNRPHVYGPWWLVVGKMGLVRADAWWLGLLLISLFIATAVAVLRPSNGRMLFPALGLMISPPVFLALERCNNDLVIFILLVAAVWFVTRQWRAGMLAGCGLIVLAAALKLYPLVALPALAVRAASRRCVLWLVAGTGVVCVLVVLDSLAAYQKVMEIAPQPITIFAYGAKLILHTIREFPLERSSILIGGVPTVLVSLWVSWRWRREFWQLVPTTGFTAGCFVAGSLAWILCYMSTTSFPYRLLLLLLPARLWLAREGSGQTNMAVRFQLGVTLLFFWTLCSKHHLLILDKEGQLYRGSHFAWMTFGFEFALGLVISGTLAFALVGWAWRRFVEEDK
jgi:hypothetical protein